MVAGPNRPEGPMPVTAKLSRKFYETFGDDIAGELVEWLNSVDAAYRSEFRDLFEVHFSRFEAKLDQLRAELRAEMRTEYSTKADVMSVRDEVVSVRREVTFLVKDEVTSLRVRIEAVEGRLIRWMFLFWVGTLGTLVALQKL
jgi:hypothetical protein